MKRFNWSHVAAISLLLIVGAVGFIHDESFRLHHAHAQTPAYTCSAGQFVNSQLANTGQSCATPPLTPVQLYFDLQPGLFATSSATAAVYYAPNGYTLKSIVTRVTGSPICTAAPTVVILDLGTSPTTAYGSATVLVSQATATSNGVFSNTSITGASVASGHYIGLGLSAGACVTAPTLSVTLQVQ